ncbi:MAG: isochorismate synthase [Tannerellaceae bacterium]|jgi:isochorismate synthase|nr:isochorismate synthase [Tannerellaceae bacterium]
MTAEEIAGLDCLIRQNRSFAMYRIPGEEDCHFLMQEEGEVDVLYDMEELNGQTGFVIAPFEASASCPVVVIRPDRWSIPLPAGEEERNHAAAHRPPAGWDLSEAKAAYGAYFSTFIEPLKEKRFEKLVLSRSVTIGREAGFSPATAFSYACKRYIRSYVYLCHTPQTGTWIGSTPEILLSGSGNDWHTVALAGTQRVRNGELPRTWNDKNLIEQMLVTAYVRKQLTHFQASPTEKGPYTVQAGELAHLKTDFRFALSGNDRLGSLLKLLHPTPAISGIPKEEAFGFILRNEAYDRRYYAGFIGWLNPGGRSDIYVNLRCMQVTDQAFTLYAGGGLLPMSTVDEEWQELEDKLQTMLVLTQNG